MSSELLAKSFQPLYMISKSGSKFIRFFLIRCAFVNEYAFGVPALITSMFSSELKSYCFCRYAGIVVESDEEPTPKTVDPPTTNTLNVSNGFSNEISFPLNPSWLVFIVT